jgi:DNA-binding MarR family transcriptional regulator
VAIADDIRQYEAIMERLVVGYHKRMVAMCKHADLTPPQFWALKTIQQLDQTKMSPLADRLGLSLGAASTLVDRLVTRGLVERTTDAQDRRAVHVSPSLKGEKVLGEVIEAKRRLTHEVFERLTPEARPELLKSLEALTAAWESLPPPPEAGVLGGCALEA